MLSLKDKNTQLHRSSQTAHGFLQDSGGGLLYSLTNKFRIYDSQLPKL